MQTNVKLTDGDLEIEQNFKAAHTRPGEHDGGEEKNGKCNAAQNGKGNGDGAEDNRGHHVGAD